MFITLTRQENDETVLVNINHIYEVIQMPGLNGCELVFPHDKVVVKENFAKVSQILMAKNLNSTHF